MCNVCSRYNGQRPQKRSTNKNENKNKNNTLWHSGNSRMRKKTRKCRKERSRGEERMKVRNKERK